MINRLSRREGVAVRGTLSIYVGGRRSFAIGQMGKQRRPLSDHHFRSGRARIANLPALQKIRGPRSNRAIP